MVKYYNLTVNGRVKARRFNAWEEEGNSIYLYWGDKESYAAKSRVFVGSADYTIMEWEEYLKLEARHAS